jgi:hypothetical protein
MFAMQGRRAAGRRVAGIALMLLHAVAVGCGDALPTAVAEHRKDRSTEPADPTHELRIIVDESDAPLRVQVVRTRVGARRLTPAKPAHAERLEGTNAKQQRILAQLPTDRKGLDVVFYRGDRNAKSLDIEATVPQSFDRDGGIEDPGHPEAWNEPLTPEEAAPLIDAAVAAVEALVNQFLMDNPEPTYEPWELPNAIATGSDCTADIEVDPFYTLMGDSPVQDCRAKKENVTVARIALIGAGVIAIAALVNPFTTGAAIVTMTAIGNASLTATATVVTPGLILGYLSNKMNACLRGETV